MSFLPTDSETNKPQAIVPGEGPLECSIAFVGEAPGSREQADLRPFIGPAGNELNKLLHLVGIVRSTCYITNVIKEQPELNNIKLFIDAKKGLTTKEAKDYINHLKDELSLCTANVIVALGDVAMWVLTGCTGITKYRGSILESTLLPGRKVIPTFHPSTLIGQKAIYLNRHLIAFDLQRAIKESAFPEINPPKMELLVRPSFDEAISFINECKKQEIIDVDIETLRDEISCISLAISDELSISIPFTYENGDYWHPEQEMEVFRRLAEIMESPSIIKRGQNFLFDSYFMYARHKIRCRNIIDTMIAQGILFPDFKKGLDFICSIHTDIPYYKIDGKSWNRITGTWDEHWLYNAKDTIATAKAWPSLISQLQAQDNVETFQRQNALIEPLLFMQARGIRMDTVGLKMASESVGRELDRFANDLYGLCGYEINYNSPQQLMDYFYVKKGIKPYINRKTGQPTTDEKALIRLSARGFKEADIMLRIRELAKLKSTYLDVTLDPDNRMRCSYNPIGAATGRLSSKKTIFNTGGNLQNPDPELKQFMLFDEGYIGYEIDLGQAENRIVAYCGPVLEMMQAFETGADVHRLTASLIFGIPYDEVSDEPGSSNLAGGKYSQRFWGKKTNHGLNYDEGPITFAINCEIEPREGKFLVSSYHRVYPGVRQNYHAMIKSMLNKNRTIINPMGRKRTFLDRLDDSLYKSGYGHFPQSTVADKIDEQGLEYVYYDQETFHYIELLLQTHDSISFQIPLSIPISHHAELVWLIKKKLETPIKWRAQEFVIPADIKVSFNNMGRGPNGYKELKKVASKEQLAEKLEELYSSYYN